MNARSFLCGVAVLFSTSVAFGQLVPPVPDVEDEIVGPAMKGPSTPRAKPVKPGDAPASPEAPKQNPRLQKLRQAQFDRRPSSILKAWAPASPREKALATNDPKTEAKPDPIDEEIKLLQRNVTVGNWPAVKAYFAELPLEEGDAGYKQLLQSLQGQPPLEMPKGMAMHPAMMMGMQFPEKNRFSLDDLLSIADAAPRGLDKDAVNSLSLILRQVMDGGVVIEAVVARFKAEVAQPKYAALTTRQAAQVICSADQAAHAAPFLPSLEKAKADADLEALNLLARHFLGLHASEGKGESLEKAWIATQATLAFKTGSRQEQEEALRRAVELAPKLKAELGQTWLDQSFTKEIARGMDILATIGTLTAQGLQTQPMQPDFRLKSIQLQKTAIEALLKAAPAKADEWRGTITLLAANWLREAEFTQQWAPSGSMHMRRDRFGNYYFQQMDDEDRMAQMQMMMGRQNMPQPIGTHDMLEARPSESWVSRVADELKPKLSHVLCRLNLKADEETKAFPLIEQLAPKYPKMARELVNEFLKVWTKNHDPNGNRGYANNPYIFYYGFEMRANSIPLTRTKQERNLTELANWVERIRKLPIGDIDEELLAKAFTNCHSSAEVYKTEAIEKVFGPMANLKSKTLAGLAQQMRENLAGVWKKPEEQKDKKTNRKSKDIQIEVMRGYSVARGTVEDALKKFPEDWSLVLARGAILHDENSYRQELGKSSEFAARCNEAHSEFQRAAKLYAAKVLTLPEEEQSTRVFEQWYYATLGAVDLQHLTEDKQPDMRQPALIRAAIQSLPGEQAEKHMARFASQLFSRLSSVKPASKFIYLKAGFEIIGDRKEAAEAKKVFDYYKDLVNEIKLEAKIDGPATVGSKQLFGVYVQLRHTRDIERESGGFGKYLQNQNNGNFYWNYGRPTADYREKFQTVVTEALKDHFEVKSVTFETDKVHSRATTEYGWRITPYAYLLLKPKGPQVDKLAPLRIDLDFLDTSGYVVLPVESAPVPLDARAERGPVRPAEKLEITQILDERQAAQGKLILEIKATARGLVPELDQFLQLKQEEFDILKTEDQGLSVVKFDPESETIAVASERTWLVTLQAKPELQHRPKSFHFAKAARDDVTMTYQRYQDADLATVGPELSLEEQYGTPKRSWTPWAIAAIGIVIAGLLALIIFVRLRSKRPVASAWKIPDRLTPFSTLGLLERIKREGQLESAARDELHQTILHVERFYFAADRNGDSSPDFKAIAEHWVGRAR